MFFREELKSWRNAKHRHHQTTYKYCSHCLSPLDRNIMGAIEKEASGIYALPVFVVMQLRVEIVGQRGQVLGIRVASSQALNLLVLLPVASLVQTCGLRMLRMRWLFEHSTLCNPTYSMYLNSMYLYCTFTVALTEEARIATVSHLYRTGIRTTTVCTCTCTHLYAGRYKFGCNSTAYKYIQVQVPP